jgi:hypothetical protein
MGVRSIAPRRVAPAEDEHVDGGAPAGRSRLARALFGPGKGGNGAHGRDARKAARASHDPRRTIPTRPNAQLAARVGLWFLVALGAFGGCVGLLRPSAEPAARVADDAASATVPADTAGFAELAVTTWVEAAGEDDEEALNALFAVNPSTNAGDAGQRRVSGGTHVVDARRVADGYWAVTVATPVEEQVDDAWRSGGTWYLEVGVAETDGRLIAVTEPALVPAPAEPDDPPRPSGGGLGVPSLDDEDMATTVEGFLSALVAADGDVSRYLAPDVTITPVTPAPFEQVTLQRWVVSDLGDGVARVRVAARGASANGVPRTVSYELGLAERAGRWEVTSLSGAPTIDNEGGAGSGASPSSSSTSVPADATTTVSIASEPGA